MKSKFVVTNVIWIIVTLLLVMIVRAVTIDSYKNVGHNYGEIETKFRIIKLLQDVKEIEDCKTFDKSSLRNFIDVKTTSLYIVNSDDKSFRFCIWE